MTRAYDVVVIGGGAAGVAAALAAAARGSRVALVRAGPGATALAAGAWRGPLPAGTGRALAAAGLVLEPPAGPLPHPWGALERAELAAPAQAAAAIEEGALVCGVAGLPGYRPAALVRLWGDAAGARLAAATLDLGALTPPAGWAPAALAAALERDPAPLAEALARAVRDAGARRAILPPVLGLDRAEAVRSALADAAGVPVGEMLAVPPSLPGLRLDRALLAAARAAGVEVIAGRAGEPVVRDGTVESVRVHGASAPESVAAREFVLATGKFAGGGIVADERLREPALGCPVWVEHLGAAFDAPEPLALTRPERAAPQPLLAAGVREDGAGRPVGRRGEVVYRNVRVAGSIRAGREAAALGLGHAAADGWEMGERAADAAASRATG
ncbi:MAG TPA: FAD-binding protein [Longimicrobiales bacterium]